MVTLESFSLCLQSRNLKSLRKYYEKLLSKTLEEKHGNQSMKIKQEFLHETMQLIAQQENLNTRLQSDHQFNPELNASKIVSQISVLKAVQDAQKEQVKQQNTKLDLTI